MQTFFRAFRIYMSSKYGKSAILKSTRRFGGPFIAGISSLLEGNLGINGVNAHGKVSSRSPSGIQTTLTDINQEGTDWLEALTGSADTIEPLGQKQHEELFFSSLICHVDPCSRLLRAYDEGDGHAASRHQGEQCASQGCLLCALKSLHFVYLQTHTHKIFT